MPEPPKVMRLGLDRPSPKRKMSTDWADEDPMAEKSKSPSKDSQESLLGTSRPDDPTSPEAACSFRAKAEDFILLIEDAPDKYRRTRLPWMTELT